MVYDPCFWVFLAFNFNWAGVFLLFIYFFVKPKPTLKNPGSATDKVCFCSYVATALWLCRK